jgi:hypothetical protein
VINPPSVTALDPMEKRVRPAKFEMSWLYSRFMLWVCCGWERLNGPVPLLSNGKLAVHGNAAPGCDWTFIGAAAQWGIRWILSLFERPCPLSPPFQASPQHLACCASP